MREHSGMSVHQWTIAERNNVIALIVCGASLIARHTGGLYWLAAVHVCALLAGLLNAWVFLLAAGADKTD